MSSFFFFKRDTYLLRNLLKSSGINCSAINVQIEVFHYFWRSSLDIHALFWFTITFSEKVFHIRYKSQPFTPNIICLLVSHRLDLNLCFHSKIIWQHLWHQRVFLHRCTASVSKWSGGLCWWPVSLTPLNIWGHIL